MDIIFDDSFRFLSNFQKQEDEIPTRISSLGSVIIEKNIRVAVDARVQAEWNKYKRANSVDRETILVSVLTDGSIGAADKKWFREQVETISSGDPSRGGWKPNEEDIQGSMIDDAKIVGEAGADVASSLKLKEAVIARMRMRGRSDQEINDVLVLFMEKVMLPFSETIKILDYCLEESLKARVDFMDIVEFWAYHYKEKRSQGLTKSIVDQAVKLQELNPTINIFNLLKNAAIGNQTEVSKVILIKDPDARLVVNNLISLAQSALPEQAEQVRRNFQFSRDALLNYQEKLKIQKALFDMMKTEEMNRSLSSFIADTSAIFKSMLTQPLYRAMRDMYYDLQASQVVLNTYASLLHDTRPITPRVTPMEEQLSPGEGMYPYQVPQQRIGSTKFVPLKKNNVVAQTLIMNPTGQGTNSVTSLNPITGGSSMTGLPQTPPVQGTLGYASGSSENIPSAEQIQQNKFEAANIIKILGDKIYQELSFLGEGFKIIASILATTLGTIIDAIKNGVNNLLNMLGDIFQKFFDELKRRSLEIAQAFLNNPVTKAVKKLGNSVSDLLFKGSPDVPNSINRKLDPFIKLAQYNPQTSLRGWTEQYWEGIAGGLVTILIAYLGSSGIRSAFTALTRASDWKTIVDLAAPAILFLKNFLVEMWQSATSVGWGNTAPTSAEYYNQTGAPGTFSAEGLRRLYNNQQVRIALGITFQEEMALARAQKQRAENMATVRIKTEILQKSMDQNVYLGGKSDVAPAAVPKDLMTKINEFLKFVKSVQDAAQAEYLILKKAIDRGYSRYDPVQKIQAQNLLSEVRNDMAVLQSLIAEYSSSALVMDHIQRKRKLMMKLGPSLKRLQALESLGISKAALITGKDGILQQLSRVRHEEASALQKLRKEYVEKTQLLDRPDIAQKEFAIPTDTRATTLPLPPLPPTIPTSV